MFHFLRSGGRKECGIFSSDVKEEPTPTSTVAIQFRDYEYECLSNRRFGDLIIQRNGDCMGNGIDDFTLIKCTLK